MKPFTGAVYTTSAILLLILLANGLYIVGETNQVILTQFGKPVGGAVTKAGLHLRVPFIQKPNVIEKRIMAWDGPSNDMPTKDKLYIKVDTFARWRISDPLQFFLRLRDERSALSRLEDILGGETRSAVAKHELIEIIRTTIDREPMVDEALVKAGTSVALLLPIVKGRSMIEKEIFAKAEGKLKDFGIALLDVRFKRINYNQNVEEKIYDRMISERMQIANRFRSEGQGEAEIILGDMERDLRKIESEAYKKIQSIKGDADAAASEIYAQAYNQSPESVELYAFLKTLEMYRAALDENTTLILTTDSDLFKYLKSVK